MKSDARVEDRASAPGCQPQGTGARLHTHRRNGVKERFDRGLITPDDPPVIGTVVGSYRIVDCLAVGGMGTVYRAEHALIGRIAAVKVLHPEMSGNREI